MTYGGVARAVVVREKEEKMGRKEKMKQRGKERRMMSDF